MSRHRLINPEGLAPARGFSYGAIAGAGRTVYLAGMTGHNEDLTIDSGIVPQFAAAARAVARVIGEAGGEPSDLVSLLIYTSEMEEYRRNLTPLGEAYREVFGRHYPPTALLGVDQLFDPAAKVELVGIAVVPG